MSFRVVVYYKDMTVMFILLIALSARNTFVKLFFEGFYFSASKSSRLLCSPAMAANSVYLLFGAWHVEYAGVCGALCS